MQLEALPAVRYKHLPQALRTKRSELSGCNLEFKALQTEIKADLETREVTLYIAGFGNIDNGNDLILKGAARDTIREDLPRDLIKFFWNHETPLGPASSLVENDAGLLMKASVTPHADFDRYLAQILDGTAAHGSLGYTVRDFEILSVKQVVERYGVDAGGRPDDMLVRVIKSMRVFEGSAVIFPMNELVRVVGVKSWGQPMEKKGLYELARVLECQDTINRLLNADWAALDDEEIAQAGQLLEQMQRAEKQLAGALGQREEKTAPAEDDPATEAEPIALDLVDLLVDVKTARRDFTTL